MLLNNMTLVGVRLGRRGPADPTPMALAQAVVAGAGGAGATPGANGIAGNGGDGGDGRGWCVGISRQRAERAETRARAAPVPLRAPMVSLAMAATAEMGAAGASASPASPDGGDPLRPARRACDHR
ncbi:hypothetical protein [Mycobacterium tuberculosis]|uniref:hypothetical protein n=1 Tax=Mycobacterium tuberculosis TaxID=1773 RepID=UPI002729D066|nr:hypothetical protein [Mycobacterium tuberculosis]